MLHNDGLLLLDYGLVLLDYGLVLDNHRLMFNYYDRLVFGERSFNDNWLMTRLKALFNGDVRFVVHHLCLFVRVRVFVTLSN